MIAYLINLVYEGTLGNILAYVLQSENKNSYLLATFFK